MASTRGPGGPLLGLCLALAAPLAASAAPADVYYERALMSAADARCRLFAPEIGAALRAGRAQARGAALRAGDDAARLAAVASAAEARAAGVACGSPDLKVAAGRVRSAFEGYTRLVRMSFPGDLSSWTADRGSSAKGATWRLYQDAQMGQATVRFGLAGDRTGAPQLVAAEADPGAEPYGARLVMRDPARAPEPYLNVLKVSAAARIPLKDRTPPRTAARVFNAEARASADATMLLPGQHSAIAFRFPAAAASALAALDPREAVTLEFLYAGGARDEVRQSYIEVGDFAAGQAFLDAGPK